MNIKSSKSSGFSLIEVLVAILIFSFGLLGIAGLMTVSIRNNHNGYMRSQAIMLNHSLVEGMRANVTGLWQGAYNGEAPSSLTKVCDLNSRCNYQDLADFDMQQWGVLINQYLPNGAGTINCETPVIPAGIIASGLWQASPPFSGICNITITWNESNETGSSPQSVNFVVQP